METDCRTHKVVVKGEKADPLKVLGRLQRKSHRRVELISPVPELPAANPPPEEKPKTEDNKPEVLFYTYILIASLVFFPFGFHFISFDTFLIRSLRL